MPKMPILIGIAGISCSGKSLLTERLVELLGPSNTAILPVEATYKDLSTLSPEQRDQRNFDTPKAIDWSLLVPHVEALSAGGMIHRPLYDFLTHVRANRPLPVQPHRFVIIEGLFALHNPRIRRHLHLCVFINADIQTCLQLRLERDTYQRGRTAESVRLQYAKTVAPMARKHVLPTRAWADLVVDQTETIELSAAKVLAEIHRHADTADRARRVEIMREMIKRYDGTGLRKKLRLWRKSCSWLMIVGGTKLLKRLIDIVVSLLMLVLLAPLFGLMGILIKLTDTGPIFFWQTRVGTWGREFAFPKLRSMVVDAERIKDQLLTSNVHGDGKTFKIKKDPRITWIGRFIRKSSIDELPQLWCVLKGDMSLVGPRPPLPHEVADYTLADRRRLDIKPGLTCIWQISGRADIPFDQQVELDVRYIDSHSLWLDCKLLFKTVPAVLLGKGAY